MTAVLDVLSEDERSALQLASLDPARELRLKIGEQALPRSELVLGLRQDGFRAALRGARAAQAAASPATPQGEGLTHEMMRLQLKEIYPGFHRR